jgi:biotin carboxyl carrier protein
MALIVNIGEESFEIELGAPKSRGCEETREIDLNGRKVALSAVRLSDGHLSLLIDGKSYDVLMQKDGDDVLVRVASEDYRALVIDTRRGRRAGARAEDEIEGGIASLKAPMPGLVVSVNVEEGQEIKTGEGIVVVEAMKMQNELRAPRDGVVEKILVKPGAPVNGGDELVVIR